MFYLGPVYIRAFFSVCRDLRGAEEEEQLHHLEFEITCPQILRRMVKLGEDVLDGLSGPHDEAGVTGTQTVPHSKEVTVQPFSQRLRYLTQHPVRHRNIHRDGDAVVVGQGKPGLTGPVGHDIDGQITLSQIDRAPV